MSKKKKVIIGVICAIVLIASGIAATLFFTKGGTLGNTQPGSTEWKKQQYGAICERGVTEGLETNTTEYAICTRDLGYKIKAIEPAKTTEQDTSENTSSTSPTVSDEQTKEAQRAGCVSLRATKLEDLIESNKQRGISESDTRITYNSGIAQCDQWGY